MPTNNIAKIGNVEQLDLIPADEFTNVPETELTEWINTGHAAIKMAVRRLAIHVAQVGAWLVAAKDKCQHGEWLPWLAENCPEISQRTAYRYTELYEKFRDSNLSLMANLPITTAYRELGIVKDPTDPEPVVTPPLPEGKYHCLVVDPPWPVQRIDRDERPNQTASWDYATMTIDEIKSFDISPVANPDGCHLYLWTTHKFLPDAFDIMTEWGFKYQCLLTWIKNVGITPFTWMYSTELVLFGRIGNLPLLKNGLRIDFSGKVREHSRKPDEFYNLVRQATPEPRLDMFSREERYGFETWGAESNCFVEV
jgi:N6-adenosine-specific RNA methylase IME4